jgi:hypothetical protein
MFNDALITLAVRGTLNPTALDAACTLHNQTAGNPQGVAAARSLGDLSHNVYVPLADAPNAATELLFLDTWQTVAGLGQFFADPQVQAGGGLMFKQRDASIWAGAGIRGHFLQAPREKSARFVGLIRGTVTSKDKAREVMNEYAAKSQASARMRGQVSHQVLFGVAHPGQPESMELLGVDHWHDADGMIAHYKEATAFGIFAGAPAVSVWKQPAGSWVEW